jgi:hypothetical protein
MLLTFTYYANICSVSARTGGLGRFVSPLEGPSQSTAAQRNEDTRTNTQYAQTPTYRFVTRSNGQTFVLLGRSNFNQHFSRKVMPSLCSHTVNEHKHNCIHQWAPMLVSHHLRHNTTCLGTDPSELLSDHWCHTINTNYMSTINHICSHHIRKEQ